MRSEASLGLYAVLVDDSQTTKVVEFRVRITVHEVSQIRQEEGEHDGASIGDGMEWVVDVLRERERVERLQPAVVRLPALFTRQFLESNNSLAGGRHSSSFLYVQLQDGAYRTRQGGRSDRSLERFEKK